MYVSKFGERVSCKSVDKESIQCILAIFCVKILSFKGTTYQYFMDTVRQSHFVGIKKMSLKDVYKYLRAKKTHSITIMSYDLNIRMRSYFGLKFLWGKLRDITQPGT